jgi:hypothetical protein
MTEKIFKFFIGAGICVLFFFTSAIMLQLGEMFPAFMCLVLSASALGMTGVILTFSDEG